MEDEQHLVVPGDVSSEMLSLQELSNEHFDLALEVLTRLDKRIGINQLPGLTSLRQPSRWNRWFTQVDRIYGTPTLAGVVASEILYKELASRHDFSRRTPESPSGLFQRQERALQMFVETTQAVNVERQQDGKKVVPYHDKEPALGVDTFHLRTSNINNEAFDWHFPFRFTTASFADVFANYLRSSQSIYRLYVTLHSEVVNEIPQHTVRLAYALYDANVACRVIGSSPRRAERYTNNIIVSVPISGFRRAIPILQAAIPAEVRSNDFVCGAQKLRTREGAVFQGISYDFEPQKKHQQFWEAVSGSTARVSTAMYKAARISPMFLDVLGSLALEKGDVQEHEVWKAEAERVRSIIAMHTSQ